VVRTGEPIQFEEYSYALQRWLECDVFSLHQGNQFAIVFRNITERKRVEASLRESEERFRSLADSMPQLVWTALPDGTVDYYNKRYREYRQIRKLEHSWEWAAVLHPDDLQVTLDAWQKALATGEIYQVEHRVQMVDGSYRWHLSRGIPVRDTEGRITRWYGTATDIHSLKRALQKLDVYTHRLERSNRDLQEFAYVASHDLQEPLRKIEAFGSALSETSENLSEKQQDYIDRMRNASGRMRSMVDSLLTLSRVERTAQPFTRVDLKHIASEVLSTLEMQIRSTGGEVEIGDLPHIYADPIQIHQLLQNLIGNALKFHDEGIPPQVKVHARQRPGHVELIVEDQGIGFEETDADRIFQPFQRLVGRNQYPGSGMGLAICRRIVERHGGTITAHSQPGKGSTFIVTLPIRQTDGL
jgi:PAS domain S-box-containing protein